MKTGELIEFLSADLSPMRSFPVSRYLLLSLALGLAIAIVLALAALGPRTLTGEADLAFLSAKVAFAASVMGIGALLVARAAVPGRLKSVNALLAIIPLALFGIMGVIDLSHVPRQEWNEHVFGAGWALCLLAIPLIAIVPFALMVLAMRRFAAPTDLLKAGAFAGMTAGGAAALAYAIHCTDDSLSFLASWYVVGVAVCAIVGALLGPRLLRW